MELTLSLATVFQATLGLGVIQRLMSACPIPAVQMASVATCVDGVYVNTFNCSCNPPNQNLAIIIIHVLFNVNVEPYTILPFTKIHLQVGLLGIFS